MDKIIAKVRLLAKAEVILFRLHLQRAARQVSLVLFAALFGLLALVMLNVALYLFLAPRIDPALGALAVAGVDVLLAVVSVTAAGRLKLGPEAEAAALLRDEASNELAADADYLRVQLDDLVQDVKRIRSAVTGNAQPGGISVPTVLQWIMMIISHLRGKRA